MSKVFGGSKKTTTSSNQMDPRIAQHLFGDDGQSGIFGAALNMYAYNPSGINPTMAQGLNMQRQALTDKRMMGGYQNISNAGNRLMNFEMAGNPFTRGQNTPPPFFNHQMMPDSGWYQNNGSGGSGGQFTPVGAFGGMQGGQIEGQMRPAVEYHPTQQSNSLTPRPWEGDSSSGFGDMGSRGGGTASRGGDTASRGSSYNSTPGAEVSPGGRTLGYDIWDGLAGLFTAGTPGLLNGLTFDKVAPVSNAVAPVDTVITDPFANPYADPLADPFGADPFGGAPAGGDRKDSDEYEDTNEYGGFF